MRVRRSKNTVSAVRRPGCSLGTCTVHDLAHRLHQLGQLKVGSAPMDKISPLGYGRRRRSLSWLQGIPRQQEGRLRPARRNLGGLNALLQRR